MQLCCFFSCTNVHVVVAHETEAGVWQILLIFQYIHLLTTVNEQGWHEEDRDFQIGFSVFFSFLCLVRIFLSFRLWLHPFSFSLFLLDWSYILSLPLLLCCCFLFYFPSCLFCFVLFVLFFLIMRSSAHDWKIFENDGTEITRSYHAFFPSSLSFPYFLFPSFSLCHLFSCIAA